MLWSFFKAWSDLVLKVKGKGQLLLWSMIGSRSVIKLSQTHRTLAFWTALKTSRLRGNIHLITFAKCHRNNLSWGKLGFVRWVMKCEKFWKIPLHSFIDVGFYPHVISFCIEAITGKMVSSRSLVCYFIFCLFLGLTVQNVPCINSSDTQASANILLCHYGLTVCQKLELFHEMDVLWDDTVSLSLNDGVGPDVCLEQALKIDMRSKWCKNSSCRP